MLDYNTASIRARFGGGIVDFSLTGIVYVLVTALIGGGFGELFSVIFQVANFIVMLRYTEQTIGMKLFQIKLVREDRKELSWQLVIARFFCMVLSVGIVMIGFLVLLLNKRYTLHDQLCETMVVRSV